MIEITDVKNSETPFSKYSFQIIHKSFVKLALNAKKCYLCKICYQYYEYLISSFSVRHLRTPQSTG